MIALINYYGKFLAKITSIVFYFIKLICSKMLKQSSALFSFLVMVLLVLVAYLSTPPAFANSATTGVLEPLYCDPYTTTGYDIPCTFANGTTICTGTAFCWQPLVDAKNAHPGVPFFAILNANNGPPTTFSSGYANGIGNLTKTGIMVLGYIDTVNCTVTLSTAESQIDTWKSYKTHGLSGIFFDDMNNTSGCEGYYTTLTNYTEATDGMKWSFGNPGTSTLKSYVGTVDKINIFENVGGTGIPKIADLQTGTFSAYGNDHDLGIDKSNFSFLVYDQCSLPGIQALGNRSNFVSLMYFTDAGYANSANQCPNNGGDANPWDRISSYLSTLVSRLDKPSALVTINAQDSLGNPLLALQVNMSQNGNIIPGGYTPFAYNGTTGVSYFFKPLNNTGCDFTKWQDTGSTTANRTITVGSTNTSYTAIYTCPGIATNNIQSMSGTVSSSPYHLTLSNFNVGNATNRTLVVGVSANNANVASITFGGTALTHKVSSFRNDDAEFWYLVNPSGTGNIVVTMSGSTSAVVGAYAFSGVDTTNPLPTARANNVTTATNVPTISISTQFSKSKVLDLPAIYGGEILSSPSCGKHWNLNLPDAISGASSSRNVPSPKTITCSWIATSSDLWDDVAVEVKPQ